MTSSLKRILFLLFFVSGFCSLLYQLVWLRLAFARFGIIAPVLSVVLSVFMLGLAAGSWGGGRFIDTVVRKRKGSPALYYALIEAGIGAGALAVPWLFSLGQSALMHLGESNSFLYLFFSAALIALSIVPWCILMGTTFPFMMAYINTLGTAGAKTNFSFLYTANVMGALAGTFLTAFVLIETIGFTLTLSVAAVLNAAIAALALALPKPAAVSFSPAESGLRRSAAAPGERPFLIAVLFITGFTSLGMEVAWTRSFTPVLGTQVYAFSSLLLCYLFATWAGSVIYRRDLRRGRVAPVPVLMVLVAAFSLLPVVLNDPQIISPVSRLLDLELAWFVALASVVPFCAALGYLTPSIIDEVSGGDHRVAGRCYAVNVLGCILGPLAASYVLLPFLGARFSLLLLTAPYFVLFLIPFGRVPSSLRRGGAAVLAGLSMVAVFFSTSYESPRTRERSLLKRDHTATVFCTGEGMQKFLSVNGVGITHLTPITKIMAHLPLVFHRGEPRSALVICFGMGTTYRSLMSWQLRTTAVELVPSVRDVFGYFFDDAARLAADPSGRIVIDDGRRFLMRTGEKFDVITIDPPPPVEASGSSLLYSEEFYALVKQRLADGGILQQWFPYMPGWIETATLYAMTRSLVSSFPYVKAYRSTEGWGVHFIASLSPIVVPAPGEAAARMPERARRDLLEWHAGGTPENYLRFILSGEVPLDVLLVSDERLRITDDKPFNEYFLLRRTARKFARARPAAMPVAGDAEKK